MRRDLRIVIRGIRIVAAIALALLCQAMTGTSVAAMYHGTFTGQVTGGYGTLFGYVSNSSLAGMSLTGSFTIDTAYAAKDPGGNLVDYSISPYEGIYRGPYGLNFSERMLQVTLCGNGVCYSITDAGLVDNNATDADQVYIQNPPLSAAGSNEYFYLYDLDYDDCLNGCSSLQSNFVQLGFSELLDNLLSSDGLSQSFTWVDNDGADSGSGTFRIYDNFQSPQGLTSRGEGNFRLDSLCYNNSCSPAPVPLPAAAWLLLSGLAGLGSVVRRRKPA